jgi:hypothetical protein
MATTTNRHGSDDIARRYERHRSTVGKKGRTMINSCAQDDDDNDASDNKKRLP